MAKAAAGGDGVHEPLIDELTFQLAQAILRERGKAYVGMSARGNGGRYEYYACSGRQKHGPKACRNERLPRHKLEHAVLEQLAGLYRDSHLVADALAKAEEEAERARPEIEQRLASIRAEITRAEQALERYYEAFEQGKLSPARCDERLSHLQAHLEDLRAQEKPNSPSRPRTRPDTARRLPILPALPTSSNASSPKASLRRRKLSSAC